MWPKIARRGPWLLVLFGIQTHLVNSEEINYTDSDSNRDNDFTEFRRTYRGFPEANPTACASVAPCHVMTGAVKTIRDLLNELETASATYCTNQQNNFRFQPPPFPSFPPFPMDFMPMPQLPQFPQFPQPTDNDGYQNLPPYQSPSPVYDLDQQNPIPAQESPPLDAARPPASSQPWGTGIYAGSQLQVHKKIKVKTCTPKRTNSGKKKHAAAMALLRKAVEDERDKVAVETDAATRAEDDIQRSSLAATVLPETSSGQEFLANDERQQKVDE